VDITTNSQVNTQSASPGPADKNLQKRKKIIYIAIGVAAFILLLTIILFVNKDEEEPKSSNPIVADYQQQLPDLEKKAADNPDDPKAQYDYAVALYATGDIEKAKDQYEKAAELDKNNASLQNNLGNAYRDLEEYEQAVESYKQAIAVDAKFLNAYMNLASLYLYTLDQPDKAIKTYQDALKNMPDNQEVQVLLGMAYEKSGEKTKAKETYQDVLEANPNNTAAQAGLKRVE
jgi:tetratricopeptide (TPR) repeat protein